MKSRCRFTLLLIFLSLPAFAQAMYEFFPSDVEKDELERAQAIVYLKEAGKMIQSQGINDAVSAFGASNSPWNQARYGLFVFDVSNGKFIFSPSTTKTAKEGFAMDDINGKPLSEIISSSVKENELATIWRTIKYVVGKSNDGREYISKIATDKKNKQGYILTMAEENLLMESLYVEALVKDAALLIDMVGTKAFSSLNNPNSEFQTRSSSVFVIDENGKILVDPISQDSVGKQHPELKALKQIAYSDSGSGWIPVPSNKDKPQLIYARSVDFEHNLYIVGTQIDLNPDATPKNIIMLLKGYRN